VVPVALLILQIVFSSVDLGLSYSRTMIVLGAVLGLSAILIDEVSRVPARVVTARGAA
jgi:hypothetical protein